MPFLVLGRTVWSLCALFLQFGHGVCYNFLCIFQVCTIYGTLVMTLCIIITIAKKLQFNFSHCYNDFNWHLSVVNTKPEDYSEGQDDSIISKYRTDIWNIVGCFLLQDGPFFIVRLTVMLFFSVYHQMLVFFTIKNFLVVMLNIYRMWVIYKDYTL